MTIAQANAVPFAWLPARASASSLYVPIVGQVRVGERSLTLRRARLKLGHVNIRTESPLIFLDS
jgi:hypothetical protein